MMFSGLFCQKRIQLIFKRVLDILVSSVCLTFLSVLFVIISVLIKLDSRGPIFFRQERVGINGNTFYIWKFRTMVDGAVNHGLRFNVARYDDRITRFGNFLRNFGIDELPQLINVLIGEMSLVGPRPTLRYQVEQYDAFDRQRLLFRPGITSLAVINGRNALSWRERINLDVEYIEKWSLWLDAVIIFKTFWTVLVKRTGIYGSEGINDDFSRSYDSFKSETNELSNSKVDIE